VSLDPSANEKGHYSKLYWKFVFLTLICSLIPLLLVGWGIYSYYAGFSKTRMETYFSELPGMDGIATLKEIN
jgi:two-component system, NtrC family, sensor kinase